MLRLRLLAVWARREWLLLALLALLPVMLVAARPAPIAVAALIDWKTIGALAGLMVLSRGLELSGLLDRAGRALVARLRGERGLAAVLVVFAAALSAVVTNDVALFITVPLTLALARRVALPVGRLVIFQALAVNAGSTLSPVGNPQNLFLWQLSGVGFGEFVLAMAPLALALMALLLALVPFAFAARALEADPGAGLALDRRRAGLSLALYPLFLIAVNAGHAVVAAGVMIALFAALPALRSVLRGVDWPLLAVFVLMFVNLGLLGALPGAAALVARGLELPGGMYLFGALVSQGMSNVPAAIFLAPFAEDWRALAWGVSVGGFGLVIGSLANLIALRLAGAAAGMAAFHAWAVPVFLVALALGAALLQVWP